MHGVTRKILLAAVTVLAAIVIVDPPPLQAQGSVPGGRGSSSRAIQVARYRNDVLTAVQPQLDRWVEAWTTGDASEFADVYTEDARLLFGATTIFGREAIGEYFEAIKKSVTGLTISLSDFYVSDRLAFAMGSYSYQVLDNGRPTERMDDVFIATFVGEGRRWHIRSHMFRVALPAELDPS